MDSRDVDQAVAEMVRVLAPHQSEDWRRPAGTLDGNCGEPPPMSRMTFSRTPDNSLPGPTPPTFPPTW
ncbi:hypothetical protein ABZ738_27370 [Micromonospora sp. NPDC047793]